MHHSRKKVVKSAAVSSAVLLGLAAGTALAATSDHTNIILKDWQGQEIARPLDGSAAPAYSVKQTCFGTNNGVACHGNSTVGNAKFSYDDIERHSYHTQLGANEFKGFNPANPDAFNPYTNAGDKWRPGAGPQGKNWVQSPGHFGSW
ncbi:cytochrome C [Geomonas azotofigens]|uniref:cytochrome C n=1 Tax=Geomonas azotofigens TaxID=2843196 RepID=UPI001C0FE2BE|nr:cytochrome C [Geomonas azotofigens]MBU5614515.1 cytochrome C [Geomonas azotofigens]